MIFMEHESSPSAHKFSPSLTDMMSIYIDKQTVGKIYSQRISNSQTS